MSNSVFRMVAGIVALMVGFVLCGDKAQAQYTNGIYAEFNTSMGSFTCRLDYVLAPKTCANFIGLATGERSWLDLTTGIARTNPFYHGQIIHRVVADFIIQGGSPNGLGTDGPGYRFPDEFHPSLRHDGFGVLSMANSGPDSNGSQYFLTVDSDPSLDDKHSVFGRLLGGSNVVYAISRVATNATSKPLVNINVTSINIRRVGPAALAFDIQTNRLPLVANLNLQVGRSGDSISLTFSNRLFADNRIYASTNLADWQGNKLGIETAPGFESQLFAAPTGANGFYRMAQIQYPAIYTPRSLAGKTITLNFITGTTGNLVLWLDSFGGGIYSFNGGAANVVLAYAYVPDAYRGRIYSLLAPGLPVMDLHLGYTNGTSGTFKGTVYVGNDLPVTGTFTSAP